MTTRLEHFAARLRRHGLAAPAAILLEAHRPLLPLLRQAGIVLSPILDPIVGSRGITSALLDDPTAYDRLLAELDADRPRADG
ncbi:MAG TPA: hypothetical protein VJA85_07835 [Candidatus Limnocylindria bacterium]|nr:hypothetical protein [Candidatus Limnocylindria bacterium]